MTDTGARRADVLELMLLQPRCKFLQVRRARLLALGVGATVVDIEVSERDGNNETVNNPEPACLHSGRTRAPRRPSSLLGQPACACSRMTARFLRSRSAHLSRRYQQGGRVAEHQRRGEH